MMDDLESGSVVQEHAEGDHRSRGGDAACPAEPQNDPAGFREPAMRLVQDGSIDLRRHRAGWLEEAPQVLAEPVGHVPLHSHRIVCFVRS